MSGYLCIAGTILCTVYGQIILKWRMSKYGGMPETIMDKLLYFLKLLLDPFIFSCFLSAFVASLFWMAAVPKFNLSYAYPLTSLSFVLVLIFSVLLFKEPLTSYKIAGLLFILVGIIISSKSAA